jgi:hypothetical protein
MAAPSKQWKEQMLPDEAALHESHLVAFEEIRKIKDAKHGKGRQLHRLSPLGLHGSLEVASGLPEHAQHGLFAQPGSYDVWIRFSNGGMDKASHRRPDIRGFALKVRGVKGPGALGNGDTDCQDFLLINRDNFGFPTSREFVGLVHTIAKKGEAGLLPFMLKNFGLIGGIVKIIDMAKGMKKPFSGYATEDFNTAAPIACGPYAVKVRLQHTSSDVNPEVGKSISFADDFSSRVAKAPQKFNLQLQFFVDEKTTPIEDASKSWPEDVAPFVTVGTLTVPVQDTSSAEAKKLMEDIEAAAFDPWGALMDHRPLGEVMRARKVVYFFSQEGRK